MTFLQHLEELRQRVFRILWVIMPLFIFYMTFTIRTEEYLGVPWPYPWPDFYNAISVMVVRGFMDGLLPAFVERVQLNPWEAIVVQFKVSLFLAVLTAMPYVVYQLAKFVAPGLHKRERRTILRITVPGTLLFAGGVLVAYLVILPFTFEFLYGIGLRMGLTPFVGPDQFFDIVLLFFVGMGVAFQTPVIMWGLAAMGLIEPSFWKRNWRYAVVGFFVFGALITPDGSGITMMLVAVPMSFLYVAGYVISQRAWKRREGPEPPETPRRKSSFAAWSIGIVVLAAVTGGFLYFNQDLFTSPVGSTESVLASGEMSLQVPAYVLYSPFPSPPAVQTGTSLRATQETNISLRWAAGSDSGRDVAFAYQGDPPSAIQALEQGHELTLFPALWTSPDLDSLELVATNGNSSVYIVGLHINYTLLLRKEFNDVNRNSFLDAGEGVLRESFVISYAAKQVDSEFVEFGISGIKTPSPEQLLMVRKGVFSSAGPDWTLEASISDLSDPDRLFSYATLVEDETLDEHGIRLFLTRSSRWSETEDLSTWIAGDSSVVLNFTFYLDQRFGAIYPVFES